MTWAQPNRECGWIHTAFALSFAVFMTDPAMAMAVANTPIQASPDADQSRITVATLIEPKSAPPVATGDPQVEVVIGHLRKKEFDKALDAANKAIRENPRNPAGYNLQGGAYLGKKDYANARKSFEKALSLQPDNTKAVMNLAQIDIQLKDFASARKRYDAILVKDRKNVDAMIGMARLEAINNNDREGIAWLERATAEVPDALTPRVLLAVHNLRLSNYQKAIAELNEAQRHHPDNAQVLVLLGKAQLANGQKSEAIATYRRLTALQPQSAEAYLHLANAQMSTEDSAGAAESLKKALALKPDYAEAVVALAALEMRAGRHAEALKLAQQLQKSLPQSPAGLALEADVLMTQQRYPQAVQTYEKAFAISQTGFLAAKLHAARTKAGNRKEADAKFQQWLKDHPDDIGAWQYSAAENLRAGQNKVAIEQYQRVLQKDPNNVLALNNLANLYQRDKDPRALDMAEQAYKLMPDSPTIADTLGWILVEAGKTARGLELVQKAVAQDPKNTEIRYHLAVALAKSGDKAKARKELETLLASKENFPQREASAALLKQM